MSNFETPQLVEAVLLWTGWGLCPVPRRDDSLLADRFGVEAATKLLSEIRILEQEFYSSDARFVAADLEEMGELSASQFKRRHPAIADEIARAFAWCYTFDFK